MLADLLKVNECQVANLQTGGECVIFDLIDELRNVFKDDKEMCQRILSAIKPSQLNNIDTKNSPALQKLKLEFSLLKITTKIAKMGKDAKFLYDSLDKDKSGSRKTVQRC